MTLPGVYVEETGDMEEPLLSVGILSGSEIALTLEGEFEAEDGKTLPAGTYRASADGGSIVLRGNGSDRPLTHAHLSPRVPSSTLVLHGVTIGREFHWERAQDQRFAGSLWLQSRAGVLTAVNVIPLEEYLKGVISSEMSSAGSPEFLKAHAVTSRSWLLAQLRQSACRKSGAEPPAPATQSGDETIRWYDREDHETFDVCADDHCQRYQGITGARVPSVEAAVQSTRGLFLTSRGEVCDARFSKACGGRTEAFENVWEPVRKEYLVSVRDGEGEDSAELRKEAEAAAWIEGRPDAFCDTTDPHILSQILVQYDRDTSDFYRWQVEYRQEELAEIIAAKSGIDFGAVTDLVPLERGESGRIVRLKIAGTRRSHVIGKELEIRKTLSRTHLYSAAFVVRALDRERGIPQRFVLLGAGWGHGVGLCQIGAAVMGEKGYTFEKILQHYFRGTEMRRLYR